MSCGKKREPRPILGTVQSRFWPPDRHEERELVYSESGMDDYLLLSSLVDAARVQFPGVPWKQIKVDFGSDNGYGILSLVLV